MRVEKVFSYRNRQYEWDKSICRCIEQIPEDIFFEQDGSPLTREVIQFDMQLLGQLISKFGRGVKHNVRTMASENQFEVDIVLPTKPKTLIEIEKGKLPRLELDLKKIEGTIYRFPQEYGYGCIIVPANYIRLNLAGQRFPYAYTTNNLIPLNRPSLDLKNQEGKFLLKDLVVIGYHDPRGDNHRAMSGGEAIEPPDKPNIINAEQGLVDDSIWEEVLRNYPTMLVSLMRKQLLEKVAGLTEKFNTNCHYFGYSTGEDRVYIYVFKKDLRIDLDISREFETNLQEEGFEVRFVNNYQGQAGWLTGWRVPHKTGVERVMKWLLKAFSKDK